MEINTQIVVLRDEIRNVLGQNVRLEVQAELHSAEIHSQQGKINCMSPILWIDLHSAQNAYVRTNPGSGGGKPEATSGKPEATSGKPEAASGKPEATSGKPEAASGCAESPNGTAAARSQIRRLYQH